MLVPRIWGSIMFTRTLLVAALFGAASISSVSAQEFTFRLHQFLPMTDSVPREGLIPWAETIEEQSEGRIKIEYYPSMILGGAPANLFDQAQDGVVDLIWTVLGYTPGRFPKSEVFEMPFLVTNAEDTSRAFQRFVEENAMDEFAGVKLIAVHTHGPGVFHSASPIESLEDLGAGFVLATHDLEIRGAGELLGDEQSGQIQEIGFSLYNEMLSRTVQALRDAVEAPVYV